MDQVEVTVGAVRDWYEKELEQMRERALVAELSLAAVMREREQLLEQIKRAESPPDVPPAD